MKFEDTNLCLNIEKNLKCLQKYASYSFVRLTTIWSGAIQQVHAIINLRALRRLRKMEDLFRTKKTSRLHVQGENYSPCSGKQNKQYNNFENTFSQHQPEDNMLSKIMFSSTLRMQEGYLFRKSTFLLPVTLPQYYLPDRIVLCFFLFSKQVIF